MKVSILMITFNHGKFINQAVESVLMQQVDFDYELVIGEDCSLDNTRDELLRLRENHPEKIKLLLSDKNLGVQKNLVRTYEACQGQYIAILEGDDYWTSPYKLQKQVDFLDRHLECSICFHNVRVIFEDGSEESRDYCPKDQKKFSTTEDLLSYNFIPTCSTMFRNGLIDEFPRWYSKYEIGDWLLHLINSRYGLIGYINLNMGVYRIHPGGVTRRRDYVKIRQLKIWGYNTINAYLNYEYDEIIKNKLKENWNQLFPVIVEQGVKLGESNVHQTHILKIFDEWPSEIFIPKEWKSCILGEIFERLFFSNYLNGSYYKVIYCLLKMVYYRPLTLKNRGVWSIISEVILGKRIANWLRHYFKKVRLV